MPDVPKKPRSNVTFLLYQMPERVSPVISFMETSHKIDATFREDTTDFDGAGCSQRRELSQEQMSDRRVAFREFMSNVPRICSPTICGMRDYRVETPDGDESSLLNLDPNYKFEWSIDQKAILHPCDFSVEYNESFYNDVQESIEQKIGKENISFFNSSVIIPSPDLGCQKDGSKRWSSSSKVPFSDRLWVRVGDDEACDPDEDADDGNVTCDDELQTRVDTAVDAFRSSSDAYSSSIGFYSKNASSKTPPIKSGDGTSVMCDGYLDMMATVPDPSMRVNESSFKTPIPLRGKQKKKLFEKCTQDIRKKIVMDHPKISSDGSASLQQFSISVSPVMREEDGYTDSDITVMTTPVLCNPSCPLEKMEYMMISPITGPNQSLLSSCETQRYKTSTPSGLMPTTHGK